MLAKYLIPTVLCLFCDTNSFGDNEFQNAFAILKKNEITANLTASSQTASLSSNISSDSDEMLAVSDKPGLETFEGLQDETTEAEPVINSTEELFLNGNFTSEENLENNLGEKLIQMKFEEMQMVSDKPVVETFEDIVELTTEIYSSKLEDDELFTTEYFTTQENLQTTSSTSQAVEWIPTTLEDAISLSDRAVVAGYTEYGSPVWVIRAPIKGDLVSGKLIVDDRQAFVPYGCREHSVVNNIEVFCAPPERIQWVESHDGSVPPNAVVAGSIGATGEKLYVGRAKEQGLMIPGKVCASHKVLYIPYNGAEFHHRTYEVLCLKVTENNVTILENNLERKFEGNLEEQLDETTDKKLEKICEKKLEDKLENLQHKLEEKVEKNLKKTLEYLLEDKLKILQQNLEERLEKKLTETLENMLGIRR